MIFGQFQNSTNRNLSLTTGPTQGITIASEKQHPRRNGILPSRYQELPGKPWLCKGIFSSWTLSPGCHLSPHTFLPTDQSQAKQPALHWPHSCSIGLCGQRRSPASELLGLLSPRWVLPGALLCELCGLEICSTQGDGSGRNSKNLNITS